MKTVLFACIHNAGRSQMAVRLVQRTCGGRQGARDLGRDRARHARAPGGHRRDARSQDRTRRYCAAKAHRSARREGGNPRDDGMRRGLPGRSGLGTTRLAARGSEGQADRARARDSGRRSPTGGRASARAGVGPWLASFNAGQSSLHDDRRDGTCSLKLPRSSEPLGHSFAADWHEAHPREVLRRCRGEQVHGARSVCPRQHGLGEPASGGLSPRMLSDNQGAQQRVVSVALETRRPTTTLFVSATTKCAKCSSTLSGGSFSFARSSSTAARSSARASRISMVMTSHFLRSALPPA
jgi:hypothetical protein